MFFVRPTLQRNFNDECDEVTMKANPSYRAFVLDGKTLNEHVQSLAPVWVEYTIFLLTGACETWPNSYNIVVYTT